MADLSASNSSFITDQIGGFQFPYSDTVVFANIPTPGKATVSGSFERKLDIREPYGASGGTIIVQGNSLRRAEILVEMWTAQHLFQWSILCKQVFFVSPGRIPAALGVSHPILEQIGLTACVIESVSTLEQSESGLWSATVKIVEWARAKPALSKPLAAIPNAPRPVPTAQDAADIQIQQLLAQRNALAAGP